MSGTAECVGCHAQLPEEQAAAAGWQEWADGCYGWSCEQPACQLELARRQRDYYTVEHREED